MSYLEADEPTCTTRSDAVELLIRPHTRDLGGFTVRRVLPAAERRMVGPFVFFDEMGPAQFAPGEGINVRPHPHIGLSTITYLFDGEILHRDSLGFVQPIEPGAVNLMTAGSGIVHSERTSTERLTAGQRLHGIQSWMALPAELEETEPGFVHHPSASLPRFESKGVTATVIAGTAFGQVSPVKTYIETLYVDVRLAPGADVALPSAPERAIYVVEGQISVADCTVPAGTMAVIAPQSDVRLGAELGARVMVLGGRSPGPRHLWWNFVSSSRDRIIEAKRLWAAGGFARIAGDAEFIPLPDDR